MTVNRQPTADELNDVKQDTVHWPALAHRVTQTDSDGTEVNIATEGTVSQLVMSVVNSIDSTAFDLNAAAFSEVTAITKDYIFDSVVLNFSTAEAKTITITGPDGTILWGGSVDTSSANLGYNTTKQHFNLIFNQGFNANDNITVAVTQFSSAGTMDCVLKSRSGTNTLVGDPSVNPVSNYFLEVSKGNITGHSSMRKFGHTENVTTSITDIWNGGGIYVFRDSATTMTASSSDVNDTSAGTGARTLEVQYLDGNYAEVVETVTLNGQTPVTVATDILRINRMIVRSAGSSGFNEGNLHVGTGAVTAGVPAVTHSEIIFTAQGGGENQTLQAIYTVPAGKTGYLFSFDYNSPDNKQTEFWLKVRPFGEVFQTKSRSMVFQADVQHLYQTAIVVTEKSDIRMSAATATGTSDMSAEFEMILVDN